jgi:hypothetical protein
MGTQYWGAGRIGTHQNIAYTGTAGTVANVVTSGVQKVRVVATTACYITIGVRPATTAGIYMPATAWSISMGGREGVGHPARQAARCTSLRSPDMAFGRIGSVGAGFGHIGGIGPRPAAPAGRAAGYSQRFATDFTYATDALPRGGEDGGRGDELRP